MPAPKVSILTPTYEHQEVLPSCIESVLSQTYTDWELWIVDDGSTDGTRLIADSFAETDSRINVLSKRHEGISHLAESYNIGLQKARGDLIAVLEGDDFWPQNKLSQQVAEHQKNQIIMSYGRVKIYTKGVEDMDYPCPPYSGLIGTQDALYSALTKQSFIMPVSAIISRGPLERIGGFQQTHGFPAVDYPTWLQLFQLPGQVMYIDRLLGYWRQSSDQTTQLHAIEIAERGRDLAVDVFRTLPEIWKDSYGLTESMLEKIIFERHLAGTYLDSLRKSLRNHDRIQARYCIDQLRTGNLRHKIEATVGLLYLALG